MKKYLELEIDIIALTQNDIITESSENDKTSDPYDSENGWWNNN